MEKIIKYIGAKNTPIKLTITSEFKLTDQEINSLKETLASKYFIPFETNNGIIAYDFKILKTNLWAEHIRLNPTYGAGDKILSMEIKLRIFRDLKTDPNKETSDYIIEVSKEMVNYGG